MSLAMSVFSFPCTIQGPLLHDTLHDCWTRCIRPKRLKQVWLHTRIILEQVRFGLHFLQLIKFKKTRAQNEALLLLEKLAWQGLQPKKNKKLKSAMRNLPILVCAAFVRVEDHDSKESKVDRSRSHVDLPKSKETMVPECGFRVIVASMFLGYSSSNETWNKSKCQPLNTAKVLHSNSTTISNFWIPRGRWSSIQTEGEALHQSSFFEAVTGK